MILLINASNALKVNFSIGLMSLTKIILVIILFIYQNPIINANYVKRPHYSEGRPGLQGHALFSISSHLLHPESKYYTNDISNSKQIIFIYGGFSNFLYNYTEINPSKRRLLHNEIYVMDPETYNLVLYSYNISDPNVKNQKIPAGRAYFDWQILNNQVLWIAGGLKSLSIDDSAYSGLADSCAFGDVWIFNFTSAQWNNLVSFNQSLNYKECSFSNTLYPDSMLLYVIFLSVLIGTISLFFWMLCNS